VFASEARRVLAGFERAVAEARRVAGSDTRLRVAYAPYLPLGEVHRFLGALRGRLPQLERQVEVEQLTAPAQAEHLASGELDLGIFLPMQEEPDLEMVPLFPAGSVSALIAVDHVLSWHDRLGPRELAGEVLIVFPRAVNPGLHDWLIAASGALGYRFREVRDIASANLRDLMLAVAQGEGIVIAPHWLTAVGGGGSAVVSRPLDPPLAWPDVMVAWRADPAPRLEGILRTVKEIAREFSGEDESDLYPPKGISRG
jgi:DNA-binding transcriptional LysR family regulator